MKKNKMMRIASVLLVAVLLSTCAISGTFAKYITTISSDDTARVAKWGLGTSSISIDNLFAAQYANVAEGTEDQGIIAPGTNGSASFVFATTATPEVAYSFTVSTGESSCADAIKDSANIKWALVKSTELNENGALDANSTEWGTWDDLMTEINALDGDETYAANAKPAMADIEYTILWNWSYTNNDDGNDNDALNDSDLGNTAVTSDLVAKVEIIITATQTD